MKEYIDKVVKNNLFLNQHASYFDTEQIHEAVISYSESAGDRIVYDDACKYLANEWGIIIDMESAEENLFDGRA